MLVVLMLVVLMLVVLMFVFMFVFMLVVMCSFHGFLPLLHKGFIVLGARSGLEASSERSIH